MRVVVDLGAAQHGGDASIPALVEEFAPDVLYGLDPQCEERTYELAGTLVLERPWAAWTHHGTVGWKGESLGGQVDLNGARTQVPCVDLCDFLGPLYSEGLSYNTNELIVKLDVEGAEYTLLPFLVATHSDRLISKLVVEWHCELCGYGIWNETHPVPCTVDEGWWRARRRAIIESLACPVEEWNR